MKSQHYLIDREFDAFKEFTDTVCEWNIRFRQLERGRFHGDLFQVKSGAVQLSYAHFNRHLEQYGECPDPHPRMKLVSFPPVYVTKHLRRLAYIAEFGNESPTVLDLCKATGASERTLRYAFQEHFGISPKTYLSVYRLNKVRKELRNGHPASIKISDIANQWGFWHMGQFAADYRKFFGELPSETRAYQRQ